MRPQNALPFIVAPARVSNRFSIGGLKQHGKVNYEIVTLS
jgi:hypothetical protein